MRLSVVLLMSGPRTAKSISLCRCVCVVINRAGVGGWSRAREGEGGERVMTPMDG